VNQRLLEQAWERALHDLAEVTAVVDVAPPPEAPEQLDDPMPEPTHRVRLLSAADDGSMLIERPTKTGLGHQDSQDVLVELVTPGGGTRMVGRCPIDRVIRHPLNPETTIHALHLGPATTIVSGQRRAFFRVELGTGRPATAELVPLDLPDARPVHGQLNNLSAGGLGVDVPAAEPDPPAQDIHGQPVEYDATIVIPGEDQPLEARVSTSHRMATDGEDAGWYLGLHFNEPSTARLQAIQQQVLQITTRLQRRQLQRRR
jgi:hypothetical protein